MSNILINYEISSKKHLLVIYEFNLFSMSLVVLFPSVDRCPNMTGQSDT